MRPSGGGVKAEIGPADFNFDLIKVLKIEIWVHGHPPPALVLRVGWGRGCVVVMAVVEDFADAATCALGDFACALSGTDADVLAGDARAFADVFRGSGGVEGNEIAGAFADALGCLSGSLGSALADVACSAANITAGAARLGLWFGLRLGGVLGGSGDSGRERSGC